MEYIIAPMLASHRAFAQVQHIVAETLYAGQRIDNFLFSHLKGVPKSCIYRVIRKGELRVNKKRVAPFYKLVSGDIIRVPPLRYEDKAQKTIKPNKQLMHVLKEAICYEDAQLLVINKPAHLAVHGGSGVALGLIEALRLMWPQAPFLELVHRLDKETSGCIMIAKKRKMLLHLQSCLISGQIEKQYFALVQGQWSGGRSVEAPLLKYRLGAERMVKVCPSGKWAKTSVKILQSFQNATLIEAKPITGRTHQIRVHCAFMQHPIVGDQKYGERECNQQAKQRGLGRLFLHANQLKIALPYSPYQLVVTAPLPRDCEQYLLNLSNGLSGL